MPFICRDNVFFISLQMIKYFIVRIYTYYIYDKQTPNYFFF